MICPKCMVQMHQKTEIVDGTLIAVGGGQADDTAYETWELKECPVCSRIVVEYYNCFTVLDIEEARARVVGIQTTLEPN